MPPDPIDAPQTPADLTLKVEVSRTVMMDTARGDRVHPDGQRIGGDAVSQKLRANGSNRPLEHEIEVGGFARPLTPPTPFS